MLQTSETETVRVFPPQGINPPSEAQMKRLTRIKTLT